MTWSSRVRKAAAVAGLLGLALLLSGCSAMYPPSPVTEQGKDIWSLYNLFFVIAAVIFVGVEGVLVWSIVRYRRKGDELPKQTHGNNALEIMWTAIPTALVLGLFVISFGVQGRVDAKVPDPPLTVDVTGFQWQWTFEYKDYGLSYTGLGNQGPVMVLPVGETVHIRLHSNNVIHSFYVPAFLFKRDVIPGQVNNFDLKIDQPGTYSGQCAQLCGMDHYQMVFTVKAVAPAEFRTWLAQEEAKAKATPSPAASGAAGSTLQLGASTTQSFDTSKLEATANQPFSVKLTNTTPGAPHNFAIKDGSGKVLYTGMPLTQPNQSVTYSVPALPAGAYTFFCSVHPNMTGTLTVK